MVKSISFKNYKIFKDRQILEIKPITVLFGKNNSGKSAVAKLPLLIEQSLKSDSKAALDLNINEISLGSELRDLVYGRANRVIEFEIDNGSDNLSVGILIANDKTKQTSIIDSWKLRDKLELQNNGIENEYLTPTSDEVLECGFNGLRLVDVSDSSDLSRFDIKSLKLVTDFLGPIRVVPLRDFRLSTRLVEDKVGTAGENAYQILINDALTTEKKLITKVSEWYKENFEGWELKINQDKAPVYNFELHREGLKQNLFDTGIGMGQVLPVVTRALMQCENETLIIIEEPETHLHPAAHANLASLFVESCKKSNQKKSFLIETHSLNFILRLRRLVAEGELDPKDIALYHVDFLEDKNYSTLSKIEIDSLGKVSKWPEDVFNETLNETIALRTAQTIKKDDN